MIYLTLASGFAFLLALTTVVLWALMPRGEMRDAMRVEAGIFAGCGATFAAIAWWAR